MKTTIISIIIVVVIGAIIFAIFKLEKPHNNNTNNTADTKSTSTQKSTQNTGANMTNDQADSGLKIKDTVVGTGETAKAGDDISVKYTGKLTDGTVFDSTDSHGGDPFEFILGNGDVIRGWDEGVVGMKVGGTRELTIPPALGYGNQVVGSIPANSTLIFTVQLVSIN